MVTATTLPSGFFSYRRRSQSICRWCCACRSQPEMLNVFNSCRVFSDPAALPQELSSSELSRCRREDGHCRVATVMSVARHCPV